MQKFNLFVGKPQKIPENAKYYYYSASSQYILLYTAEKSIAGFLLVDEEQIQLSSDERKWLFSCKVEENKKAIQENEAAYIATLETYISYLEDEVKKLKEGGQTGESSSNRG